MEFETDQQNQPSGSYSLTAIVLHWLLGVALLGLFGMGLYMAELPISLSPGTKEKPFSSFFAGRVAWPWLSGSQLKPDSAASEACEGGRHGMAWNGVAQRCSPGATRLMATSVCAGAVLSSLD